MLAVVGIDDERLVDMALVLQRSRVGNQVRCPVAQIFRFACQRGKKGDNRGITHPHRVIARIQRGIDSAIRMNHRKQCAFINLSTLHQLGRTGQLGYAHALRNPFIGLLLRAVPVGHVRAEGFELSEAVGPDHGKAVTSEALLLRIRIFQILKNDSGKNRRIVNTHHLAPDQRAVGLQIGCIQRNHQLQPFARHANAGQIHGQDGDLSIAIHVARDQRVVFKSLKPEIIVQSESRGFAPRGRRSTHLDPIEGLAHGIRGMEGVGVGGNTRQNADFQAQSVLLSNVNLAAPRAGDARFGGAFPEASILSSQFAGHSVAYFHQLRGIGIEGRRKEVVFFLVEQFFQMVERLAVGGQFAAQLLLDFLVAVRDGLQPFGHGANRCDPLFIGQRREERGIGAAIDKMVNEAIKFARHHLLCGHVICVPIGLIENPQHIDLRRGMRPIGV